MPYLDAECEGDFDCGIAVIYGHHLNNGTVFSVLAEYSDPILCRGAPPHPLADPRLETGLRGGVRGGGERERADEALHVREHRGFPGVPGSRPREGGVVLKDASPTRMCALQLVTCSYSTYRNERTVVTATVAEEYR